ncbi:MAG: protein kinase [Chloroflexi bacterium]|nr:protein kinase [Chloroflexota bacterium]
MNENENPFPAETNTLSVPEGGNQVTPASLEGQTLGKYRVLEPLGRGGMARVYRAFHPQLNRYVAIKVLRSDLVDEEEFLVRFRREAQAVAALRHPNVVQVFDSDVQDEVYYMVLELLEGDALKTRLNDYRTRDERMPLGEMVRVLLDVLDGMAYAHSEGMIHRDIKPGNILLTKRGQAVVADFGIARIVGSTQHTAAGALMGTLNYISPEQGLQGQSDARSDIYSLGIVLYEMLTQRTPFEADTPLAVLMKHVNDPLPLPRRIDPYIPESFERIVLRALAKDPDDRYQNAEEMAHALREAAVEAEIELPSRISLPLSFTTTEAPAESVAVFSGTALERLSDAEFADDDTDTNLGDLTSSPDDAKDTQGGQALGEAGKELLGAMGAVAHVALSKTSQVLRDAAAKVEGEDAQPEPDIEPDDQDVLEAPEAPSAPSPPEHATDQAVRGKKDRQRGGIGLSIMGAIALLVLGNVCLLTMAVPMDWWDLYDIGWPIQIFLLSWGLCMIMFVTSSIWTLIPTGLALVTGIILTYCQLTGNWDHWNFLWIFEVWGGIISIVIPIFVARSKGLARFSSRFLAILLSLASIVGILFVALSVSVGNLFIDWGSILMR